MFRSTSSNNADGMERNLAMLASHEPEKEPSPGLLMINTSGDRVYVNQLEELMKENVFRSGVNENASCSGLAMRQPQVVSLEHGLDISFTPPHETEPPEYTSNNIYYNNPLNLNNVNEEGLEDNLPVSWPQIVSLEQGLGVTVTPPQESEQHVDGFGNFQFTHLNSINHQVLEDNICQDEGTQSEPQYSSLANLFLNTDQVTELSITASGEVEHVASVSLPLSTPAESFENNDGLDNMETQVVETRKKRGRNRRKERAEEIKAEKTKKKALYDDAIRAYKNKAFKSYRKCAEHFGINNSVLRKFILSGTGYVGKGAVNQVLTNEEQKDLKDHLIYMSEIGFGYTTYDLKLDLQQLLSDLVRYVQLSFFSIGTC